MKKYSIGYKTVLLGVVCAIAGVLLALVNSITAPVIAENSLKAVQDTLNEFFPGGTFSDVTSQYVTSDTDLVDGVYEAKDQGYVFTLHNIGYDSGGFTFAMAFDNNGKIVGYKALEQNETPGKGSLAFEDDQVNKIKELTSNDELPLISGATVTTTAVRNAADQAETIVNQILGKSNDKNASTTTATPTPSASTASTLGAVDPSVSKASCEASGNGVYACKATGFAGELTANITVENGKITNYADLTGPDDGDGVGDEVFGANGLDAFKNADSSSAVDSISGATHTSDAVNGMAAAALKAASK